jgi:chromosome segregation ATPase
MAEKSYLIPQQSRMLIDETLDFCASITEISIDNDKEYQKACSLTKDVQGYLKKIDQERKSVLQPFRETIDIINEAFQKPQDALDNLKTRLRKSIGDYTQLLERKRLEAQRKAEETARNERERLAAEARAKEEAAKKLAQKGETEKAQQETEKAQTLQQIAEKVEAPEIETNVPEVKGVHTRDKYSGELVDKRAFLDYALNCEQSTVMLGCVKIDMTQINKMIQSTKGKIVLPGIEIHVQKIPVFR